MSYQKLSIREAVNFISEGRMFLPEIQRNFVWKEEQIENLFDSLLLGYPIGALLFWKASKKDINNPDNSLNLYEFINNFHERDNHDNPKASLPLTTEYDSYFIVLDGQQRLSSLYISLKGTLARKLPRCWWNNDDSFPKKELYINLDSDLAEKVQDDDESKKFKFLTENEAVKDDKKWFKVKNIFAYDNEYDMFAFADKKYETEKAGKNLLALYKVLTNKETSPLSFYEIEEADYDDVLNIFVRVNSSGTPLSKTDLLFSTIVSTWNGGRDEIQGLINTLNGRGGRFAFNTDFIMRACLTLTDSPINLKINSFKKANVEKVQNYWNSIKQAISDTVTFLTKTGFSDESITSYNALLPITYYLFKGGQLTKENIESFKKFFIIAQVKNIFGVSSNTAISETRKAVQTISDCKKTPFSLDIFDGVKLTGNLDFTVTEDTINRCFDYDKGPYTFMILSLLYPEVDLENNLFHQDHVHPYTGFDTRKISKIVNDKEKIAKWQSLRNKIPNLELLKGTENESKNATPIEQWLKMDSKHVVKFWPENVSTDLRDFEEFYTKRESLMKDEIKKILGYYNG